MSHLHFLFLRLAVLLSDREVTMLAETDTAEYQAALKEAGNVVPDPAYTHGASVAADVQGLSL